MLQAIAFYPVFGKPFIMYLGILTLTGFLATAAIAVANRHGIHTIPFVWHPRLAVLSIACAVIHGTLGILMFF